MFRSEVARAPDEAAIGSVRLTSSRSMSALVLVLLTLGALALLATLGMSYSRTIKAPAWVLPTGSLVRVPALTSGAVLRIAVREGDAVHAGDALVIVTGDRVAAHGPALARTVQDLADRDARLQEQLALVAQRRAARPAEYERQRAAIERARAASVKEMELLRQRIELAETAVRQSEDLQRDGFVSSQASRDKRDALLDLRLRLEVAKRASDQIDRTREEAGEALARASRDDDIERSRLQQERHQLAAEIQRADVEREQIVVSPLDGVVAALPVQTGDFVALGQSVVTVLSAATPASANAPGLQPLVAWIPSRSMEGVAPGAVAWVSYDAYATQWYGRQRAVVTGVSRTPIDPADLPPGRRASLFAGQPEEPLYRVDLSASTTWRGGLRSAPRLTPGMGARVQIVQARRRVLDWLLEPLRRIDARRND